MLIRSSPWFFAYPWTASDRRPAVVVTLQISLAWLPTSSRFFFQFCLDSNNAVLLGEFCATVGPLGFNLHS
jgi:hypothetical protein